MVRRYYGNTFCIMALFNKRQMYCMCLDNVELLVIRIHGNALNSDLG